MTDVALPHVRLLSDWEGGAPPDTLPLMSLLLRSASMEGKENYAVRFFAQRGTFTESTLGLNGLKFNYFID